MNRKIKKVWEKGIEVPGYPSEKIRKDVWGAWIFFNDLNDTNSPYGWVIDYIYLRTRCSIREIENYENITNLRLMQWKNAKDKGDDFPCFCASITANGERNVPCDAIKIIDNECVKEIHNLFDF